MAYRLERGESPGEGVKRIADEQMASAVEDLRGKSGASREKAIHETRKSIKKVRALLRLVRVAMGDAFAGENKRLRDLGRKLSPIRDAEALVTAFDDLRKHQAKSGKRLPASVRRALVLHQKHVEEEMGMPRLMAGLAAGLAEIRKSAKQWPIEADGFRAVETGLRETYRQGKDALAVVHKTGRREDFHEWRKRVKDHWYHVRLLTDLWTDAMKEHEKSLKDLEQDLGEDLNLALLRELMAAEPEAFGKAQDIDRMTRAIDERRKEYRAHALEIGALVYGEKPRRFVKEMRRLWENRGQ